MNAPTPRTADGHPDLSGVWEITRDPQRCLAAAPHGAAGGRRRRGRAGQGGGSPFGNIGDSMPERRRRISRGPPSSSRSAWPTTARTIRTRTACRWASCSSTRTRTRGRSSRRRRKLLLIYEASGTTVREIFLDGRPLPKKDDVEPWYNGYSVGHWEGDTLVVETTGLMDDGWLDVRGSPLTSDGEAHRALPPAEFRHARDRSDHRRSEGLHEAVHGEGVLPLQPRHAADRVRVYGQGRAALISATHPSSRRRSRPGHSA